MSNVVKLKPAKSKSSNTASRLLSRPIIAITVIGGILGLMIGALLPLQNNGGIASASSAVGTARIVDGDTLWIGDIKIRLHGIDAPEADQICNDVDGTPYNCGKRSTQALTALVASESVRCEGDSKDRYGRLLAVCYVGEKDLNSAMVSRGWAVAFRKYSQEYISEEQSAKQAKIGMWVGEFQMPWDWRHGPKTKAISNASSPTSDCQIKGNISKNGKIYHLPGSRDYNKTRIDIGKGERWFCSEEQAANAGWRKAR